MQTVGVNITTPVLPGGNIPGGGGDEEGENVERLYRSKRDRVLAGVCGGLGEYFDVDPHLVRLGVLLLTLATGILPVGITYLVAWMILPEGGEG